MKLSLALIVAVIALLATVNSQKSPATCSYKNGNKNYNFTQMIKADYYTLTQGTTIYNWNICKALPNNICTAVQTDGPLASCQVSSNNPFNTGLLSSGQFQPLEGQPAGTDGMQILYNSNTKPCASSGQSRQTQVRLICDPNQAGTTVKGAEETSTKCVYDVQLVSKFACAGGGGGSTTGGSTTGGGSEDGGSSEKPKKGGIGGGWIFIIILLCSTTVYILVGLIVNYKVRGLRGKEMFPNYSFWTDTFGGLLKDGILFIKSKVTRSPSGYQQV